jgi:rsbT co-antagonist protein RsbR
MTNPITVPSLFHSLQNRFADKLNSLAMPKASLVDISHLIEDIVINNKLKALVLTGFQESGYWDKESARYLQLAGIVTRVCVFAQGNLPLEDSSSIFVRLEDGDPLRQEWFLIVITTQFCCLLCGLDSQIAFESEAERVFETFFSFDPEHINISLDILEEALVLRNPAKLAELKEHRLAYKLGMPDPFYFNLIMNRMIEHLFRYQEVAKQLAEERATRAAVSEFLHQTSQPLTSALLTLDVMRMSGEITPEDLDFLYNAIDNLKGRLALIRSTVKSPKLNSLGNPANDGKSTVIKE